MTSQKRRELMEKAVKRGKYAPLYRHLQTLEGREWRTSFAELETVLGFNLPDSAWIHRPWWANQGQSGGHSHSQAWQMAGWKTAEVRLDDETLVFLRDDGDPE